MTSAQIDLNSNILETQPYQPFKVQFLKEMLVREPHLQDLQCHCWFSSCKNKVTG